MPAWPTPRLALQQPVRRSASSRRLPPAWWTPVNIIRYITIRNPDLDVWVHSFNHWQEHFQNSLTDGQAVGRLNIAVVNTVDATVQTAAAGDATPGVHWFVVAWRVLALPDGHLMAD